MAGGVIDPRGRHPETEGQVLFIQSWPIGYKSACSEDEGRVLEAWEAPLGGSPPAGQGKCWELIHSLRRALRSSLATGFAIWSGAPPHDLRAAGISTPRQPERSQVTVEASGEVDMSE
jgi:hypothetical protein